VLRQVEAKVAELREVSAGDDSAAIKAKIEELQKEVMAIGQVRPWPRPPAAAAALTCAQKLTWRSVFGGLRVRCAACALTTGAAVEQS
jgi:hypothetical protein